MTNRGITGQIVQSRGEVEFEWRIVNFNPISEESNVHYRSSSFHFMDSKWYIQMRVNGNDSEGWISLYLTRDDQGPLKSLNYSFDIKNESLLEDKFQKLFSGCNAFEVRGNVSCGLNKAFEISELLEKKSWFLPSDVLTIRCCLKDADTERPYPVKLIELNTLSGDLGNLLVGSTNYDVTLKVDSKEFWAHRSILAARSEVFYKMFEHKLSESNSGVVNIVDCDPGSFGDFLRYLYTGKVEGVTQEKVLHLYKTADKYAVLKLKSFCIEFMVCHLSADNMCAVAKLAKLHDEEELFDSVQTFFNKNMAKVFETTSWKKLLTEDKLLANKLLKKMASKIKIQD